MNDQHNHQLMIRYLQGACSPDEKTSFYAWLQASAENRAHFYEVRLLWHASRIEHFRSKEQLDKALDTFTYNIQQRHKQLRKKIYLQTLRYAAIAAGVFFISWMFLVLNRRHASSSELITTSVLHTDSSKLVVLHDGTRVWLNSNSKITYPRTFSNQERRVTLEGEAFFDVTHDNAHPFIVNTSTILIKVLGTTFNVQAYGNESQTEAVLVSGKIAISDSEGRDIATITPGQMALVDKNNHNLIVNRVNPEPYISWRYGQITLTGANLKTITRKLSELYPVNFSFAPSLPDTTLYNFFFSKRKPLTEVMNMLCFIAPIHYQIQGKNVLITPK